ncbi:MAG: histidine phosphotransferase family protein [Paracoccus sp. (in: a-proteobacteria)]|uniref:histidine phosphotransferase family protein n=1 Tax=Paracoccus sp. TaxID=267 RepID=UPI0026E0315B|nr:histidine phosphotransferase family protein [Paracoccus sp. (in: a-proteobacteria)]MDO5622690.1 histidine phosphotransferase family protein [Paracoccus sp. (in: a-proteobacteria)]
MNQPAMPPISADLLAGLVGSRLCHDLVSPLGAIGNGVELLEMTGIPGLANSPEMALIAESVAAARSRLQLFRVAFGAGSETRLPPAEIAALVRAVQDQSRLSIELAEPGDLPRSEVRLLLLALMCLQDTLPYGGRVLAARRETRWSLVAEAERMKPDSSLWGWLTGTLPPALRPGEVQFALLATALTDAGRQATVEIDATGAELLI